MGTWSQHFSNVEGSFDLVECDRCAALVRKDRNATKKHWDDHEETDRAIHEAQGVRHPEPPVFISPPKRTTPGWGNR